MATRERPSEPDSMAENHDAPAPVARLGVLRRAVQIYLDLSYAGHAVPEAVARRLEWDANSAAERPWERPPFERQGAAPGREGAIYALRLGNHRYPHMKLQVQPWPNEAGFMLSVNTHDQIAGTGLGPEDERALREIQVENQRLKEAVEQAWDDAELPTFHRYLRDYIEGRKAGAPSPSPPSSPPSGPVDEDRPGPSPGP